MAFIHSSAFVDDSVKIGYNTNVWHFCHISTGAIIGKNCIIGQGCFIGENVIIGDNVKIQNNVSIYEGVTIEDDVFLGPSCVFTNVKLPRVDKPVYKQYVKTFVKQGASIGANATILPGVTIGEYAFVGAGSVVTKNVDPLSIVVGNPANLLRKSNEFGDIEK